MPKPSHFEEAAEVLARAMKATGIAEQGVLLEEALRLNRLALAEERRKLALLNATPPLASAPETSAPGT